jgi:hypothetical protein
LIPKIVSFTLPLTTCGKMHIWPPTVQRTRKVWRILLKWVRKSGGKCCVSATVCSWPVLWLKDGQTDERTHFQWWSRGSGENKSPITITFRGIGHSRREKSVARSPTGTSS